MGLHHRSDYRTNGWIYIAYSLDRSGGTTTVIDRARLAAGNRLTSIERVFEAKPVVSGSEHYGGRLLFANGFLYLTLGDRNTRDMAQYLGDHHGKILRFRDDGSVPADNPFVGRDDAMPEIWSIGHRNPQGLAAQPGSGQLWANEHGPLAGDEVNIIRAGANYGWPLITWGREYYGALVGKGLTRMEGLEQPAHYWVPGIAPSGLAFYSGDRLPAWRGNLFSGAMSRRHLNRLVFDNGRVVKEERLLLDRNWRVRCVVQGPDGNLYLGVDDGMVIRIRPAS
ncbi:MAG: PQQ-dependent sugar dehydrogenase [Gemmatimonadota bacterium]